VAHLAPTVSGILAPGSTGDGWEMDEAERSELLQLLLGAAGELDLWLLIGVLKTDRGAARESIARTAAEITGRPERGGADSSAAADALAARRVCGFTVTPPKGTDLSEEQIGADLEGILELGYPVALYQLPQVTENEMSPALVSDLAGRYPNFYLFKDTSGEDRVAESGVDTADVFMVRGAEGNYAGHLRESGGVYDGFLLSTANCFAPELARIIKLLENGRHDEAAELSGRVSNVVDAVFAAVSDLAFGNPFANANKAIDHVLAWHPKAAERPAPMTHSGNRLPEAAIQTARHALEAQLLLPERGYLAG
jgi:dihydrodipicolinate synthase/N-acetylneuraminate lyase